MHPEKKISPAFEPYLADSRRRDKHEAVVIYQAPTARRPKRGHEGLRVAEERVQYVAEQAVLHKEVESRIFNAYADTGDESLMMSPIGGTAWFRSPVFREFFSLCSKLLRLFQFLEQLFCRSGWPGLRAGALMSVGSGILERCRKRRREERTLHDSPVGQIRLARGRNG